MIDRTLINTLEEMAKKERKVNFYKTRPRIKGRIIEKKKTKKGNIKLTIKKRNDELSFIVLKSHKEIFALAEKLKLKNSVSAAGIRKLRMNLCTQLREVKGMDDLRQTKLQS